MSEIATITVNVDEYLSANKYEVDEENAHIELVEDPDMEEFRKLVRVCPAALYKIDEEGNTSFDYAGCLECGTCRIACGDTSSPSGTCPSPPWAWSTASGRGRRRPHGRALVDDGSVGGGFSRPGEKTRIRGTSQHPRCAYKNAPRRG